MLATLNPVAGIEMGKKRTDEMKPLFTIKGRQEWSDWVKELSDTMGMSVSAVIDHALRELGKREGLEKPMPKRITRADK